MTTLPPEDQKRVEEIKKTIESVLLNRIKHIGDDEQLYTGYPVQLIDELATTLLTQKNAEIEAAVEAEREKCIMIVNDYGERMSELHSEMISTAYEDSKMMLAFDMHSRLIAVKHITEKMKALTPTKTDKQTEV